MPIAVNCSHCGKTLKVKDEFAGKKGKCPSCNGSIPIPPLASPVGERVMKDTAPMAAPRRPERAAATIAQLTWRKDLLKLLPEKLSPASGGVGRGLQNLLLAQMVLALCLSYVALLLACVGGGVALAIWGPASWGLPAGAAYGLAALCGLFALLLFKPIAASWFSKVEGYEVQGAKEPELFAILEKLQVALGCSRGVSLCLPMDLVARADVGEGLLASLFGKRVRLAIGLPLIAGCNVDEVIGLLALPLARHGQGMLVRMICGGHSWLSRICRGEDAWDRAIRQRSSDPKRRLGKIWLLVGGCFLFARFAAWPFWFVADLLVGITVDSVEEQAVKRQAELVGTTVPVAAAGQLGLLEFAWQGVAADVLFQHREKRLVDDLIVQMRKNLAELPDEVKGVMSQPVPDDPQEMAQRHITAQRQQEVLAKLDLPGIVSCGDPATLLFKDFAATCREATWEYYLRRLGPRIQQRKDLLSAVTGEKT